MEAYTLTLWIAFLFGLIVGWAWKPKWARRGTGQQMNMQSTGESWGVKDGGNDKPPTVAPSENNNRISAYSTSHLNEGISCVLTEEDLKHLCLLVEMRDGGPSWIHIMDRSTPNMSYQSSRRDPMTGPSQYHSKTVFEAANSKMVRDFFWEEEFRPKCDEMLSYSSIIEQCPITGTMVVQWIRKFPFFCRDREYVIGRRIWELDGSYYCVTKGVHWPSVSRRNKPRRVDLYYSSWYIRAVESGRHNGQDTAIEVLLFHHEDLGIPWEIANLGIRKGMWGMVKKVEPGLRAYQSGRAAAASFSRHISVAQTKTKITAVYMRSLEGDGDLSKSEIDATSEKPLATNMARVLIIGGVVVLACSLNIGLLSKAFIFGMGRKLANRGKQN